MCLSIFKHILSGSDPMIKPWRDLPEDLRIPELKPYYRVLYRRRGSLLVKRWFDVGAAALLLILLAPAFIGIAVWIKLDSRGPVFFRQERVTQYGKTFRIYKFRTMVTGAEAKGDRITVGEDKRITRVGRRIRAYRLDEIPQLLNILQGDMTFVGTRPEVPEYVRQYLPEWKATLLLPAGVTSTASVEYRNEDEVMEELTKKGISVDLAYTGYVLPKKMAYNLQEIKNFTVFRDFAILIRTVLAMLKG